jgi:hypothetical protein
MTQDWRSRDLPGVVAKATATDLDVMRMLRATRSSTVTLLDLRARLPRHEAGLRDSLWALEAGGLVEVLDSSTTGLIRYARGVTTVVDRAGLEAAACDRVVRAAEERRLA